LHQVEGGPQETNLTIAGMERAAEIFSASPLTSSIDTDSTKA
jgi:hypothetical protein